MTTVTAVTAFLRAAAVSKTSSQSSRLSRGAGSNVKGVYLRVEIAARQYNPNPLTFGPRRTLAGWWERLCLSHLPNGEWQSLGGVQGALFKGRPCWGRQPQLRGGGAPPPHTPSGEPTALSHQRGESVIVGYYTSRRKCLPQPRPFSTTQHLKQEDFCLWREATVLTVPTQEI